MAGKVKDFTGNLIRISILEKESSTGKGISLQIDVKTMNIIKDKV